MTRKTQTGKCLCGAVRFEVDLPVKWCAHCHCKRCRPAHGAAFVTWFGVDRENFRFLEGEDKLTRWRSAPEAVRSFCSACGSSMFFESERWPDEVHVALGCMDGPIDREPSAHVYYHQKAEWFTPNDDLKKIGDPLKR
jgi:hypothetical protein